MTDYDPFKPFKRRSKKDEFDIFHDEFFERFDVEFRRIFEQMSRLMEESLKEGERPKSFVHGFSITIGPDGKPIIRQFGDRPVPPPAGARRKERIEAEREPLVDVIEGAEEVTVTVEIPGVEKDDIDLSVTEDELKIKAHRGERKYSREIKLPVPVLPDTTKATYKNGILDVVVKRAEKKEEGKKVKIE